jgi:glycosyltransferase involved in cell wall biosynthesis
VKALIVSHAAIKSANRSAYRSLARRGIDVTVAVPDRWNSAFGALEPEPEPLESEIRVIACKRGGISHSNVYWLHDFDRFAGEFDPDAIYVDEDPAGFAAGQAARVADRRRSGLVVLAVQNLLKHYPAPFNVLQRYVFRRARAAVSLSDQATETLRARGFNGPVHYMPFVTDLVPPSKTVRARTRAQYTFDAPTVGYVGRLVSEKGVDTFLHALALLPGVRGAIVGDGPERASLEALTSSLGLEVRVQFLGAQSPDDARSLIGAFDAIALPSRTRPNWSEQFGRVLIEAMASGVPVVASDSGAIGEVVGDAAVLVPEDNPPALASGLLQALDSVRAPVFRERGLARVSERFSPGLEVDALLRALNVAMEGTR